MSDSETRELLSAVKYLKAQRAKESMSRVLSTFGKALPKGIRHPDSLVRNAHLYMPGRPGNTRLY